MTEKPKPPEKKKVTCGHCGAHDFTTKPFRVPPGEIDLRNPTGGARAVTGAGAVVLRDVPDGATAVGVPARLLPGGTA